MPLLTELEFLFIARTTNIPPRWGYICFGLHCRVGDSAAKLAIGYLLDELKNDITRETPASFEPGIDYVVTKIPRFAFEKFPQADPTLTTQMNGEPPARAPLALAGDTVAVRPHPQRPGHITQRSKEAEAQSQKCFPWRLRTLGL